MTAAAQTSDDDRQQGTAGSPAAGTKGEGAAVDDATFAPFRERMRAEGLPDLAIEAFRRSFEQLVLGRVQFVREEALEPADEVPDLARLDDCEAAGRAALAHTAVIKLNGGLATSMGMTKAKSLLEIKDGLSFLDVIARQIVETRKQSGAPLPLLLMNSFRTRDDSLAALAPHGLALDGLPLDFVQHKIPRIALDPIAPAEWPKAPEHEWCPPGHGDLYCALVTSGALERLLARGFRYAFVSNADNLGATLEPRILGWMQREGLPFVMEVTARTAADRKGGHLARRREDGRLVLREVAQCAPEDEAAFQDIRRHRFFNTNNIWIDLEALRAELDRSGGVIDLPVIKNEKNVDPLDPASPKAVQLETAMGAAIECFAGARAVAVPRTRFAPVKTTSDLLVVWSDAYRLDDQSRFVRTRPEAPAPLVELDSACFKRIDQFLERFPEGPPSLRECVSLRVEGDVCFGAGVRVVGDVVVRAEGGAPHVVEPGTTLEG